VLALIILIYPQPQIWEISGDNRYTAIGQQDEDAVAWSTESFKGDLKANLDLKRAVKALNLGRDFRLRRRALQVSNLSHDHHPQLLPGMGRDPGHERRLVRLRT